MRATNKDARGVNRWFGLALTVSLAACGGGGGPGDMQMPPAGVGVAEVVVRNIIEWDEFSGRIQAVDTVEIRPRVTGYLTTVHFDEGALVQAGDLLFTIDQREYAAAVSLARANVNRAQTRVALAEQEVTRGDKLLEARALSSEEMDQRNGELKQARADLASAGAELQRSQLDLEFTELRAPITGRIGAASVRPGNLVSPGETLLTTLVSIDPIHVVFEGDERIYLKYQAQAAAGERPSSRDARNPVQVGLASDTDYPYRGVMNFVDNQINAATGTIQGRAELPNPDGYLIPGLFARVRLLGSGEYEAVLVHDVAILTDQDRQYVYVVDEQNRAQRRDVQIGRAIDGLRVVEQGLAAGDRIVVNGVRKIFFAGAPVNPTDVPMDDPTASAAQTPQAPAAP
ncbi:MAG: efflux RND transporter periplasmic adaptor subunit [Pseudomonadota bacterium]